MPVAALRTLGLLLLLAAGGSVGRAEECLAPLEREEDEAAAMVQLRRSETQASTPQERSEAEGVFNYSNFQTGTWPVDFPNCMGMPTDGLDHNEWQSPIDISLSEPYGHLPKGEAPRFKHEQGGCQEGYFHASPVGWQVDLRNDEEGVNCENLAVTYNGTEYALVQFHFHVVSEHTLGFKPFAGELHMVHTSAEGEVLVVGVLLEDSFSKASPALQKIREDPFLARVFRTGFETDRVVRFKQPLDPYSVLSVNGGIWQYQGSLTTPPCTPGVQWLVAKKPVRVATSYLDGFRVHLKEGRGDSYGHNRRPAQALSGRKISKTFVGDVCPGKTRLPLKNEYVARALAV